MGEGAKKTRCMRDFAFSTTTHVLACIQAVGQVADKWSDGAGAGRWHAALLTSSTAIQLSQIYAVAQAWRTDQNISNVYYYKVVQVYRWGVHDRIVDLLGPQG